MAAIDAFAWAAGINNKKWRAGAMPEGDTAIVRHAGETDTAFNQRKADWERGIFT